MKLELFINFNGNCREAVNFYAKVFKSEISNLMTYQEAPSDPEHPPREADRDRIMYAGLKIGDQLVMFMDVSSNSPTIIGNNINPTLSLDDKEEISRLFDELRVNGEVYASPQKTFFSDWYCMVKDQFGIVWQIVYYVQA